MLQRFVSNIFTITLVRKSSIMQCNRHIQKMKHDMQLLFDTAVKAVQPRHLLQSTVVVRDDVLNVSGKQYKLKNNCYLVGFGKAVFGMAIETEHILQKHLVSGIISVPVGIMNTFESNSECQLSPNSVLKVIEGAKDNLPDKSSNEAAHQIADLVQNLGKDDLLIVLISGGGSALLPFPIPPITLEEKSQVVKLLATAGANINELNCVRKKLSVLKGGGLAKLAFPAQVISLILSDIVGDPLDLIASGPTVLNTDSSDEALNIVNRYSLMEKIPLSVQKCLKSEDNVRELEAFAHVHNVLIGSNLTAVSKAAEMSMISGYNSLILSTEVEGNVACIGNLYASLAESICKALQNKDVSEFKTVVQAMRKTLKIRENVEEELSYAIQNLSANGLCIVAGGETTVVVKGKGVGGRNQELSMVFTRHINERSKNVPLLNQYEIVFLSAGTDGIDGPTNAAGAFGYRQQLQLAKSQNLDPLEYEKNNDSYNYYKALIGGEDLITTGHTGTNVMDIHILLIKPII